MADGKAWLVGTAGSRMRARARSARSKMREIQVRAVARVMLVAE